MEISDIQLWSSISSDQVFQEFLHLCIDEVCSRRGPSYDAFKTSSSWTEDQFSAAVVAVHKLVGEVARTDWSNGKVLERLSGLPPNHQKMVLECLEVRRADVLRALQQDQCSISGSALEDFDWKLKWVAGSSALSMLREPLLEVDLHLSGGRGSSPERQPSVLSLELDCGELKLLLSTLEKAQETLNM